MKRSRPHRKIAYAAPVVYLLSVALGLPFLVGVAGALVFLLAGTAGHWRRLQTARVQVNDGLEYLARRRAALGFAAASVLAAAAGLVNVAPPQDAAPVTVALAIDGIPRTASPGIEVVASIDAREPAPWGCHGDVEVNVTFTATNDFRAEHREILERPGSRIVATVGGDYGSPSIQSAGVRGLGGSVDWDSLDHPSSRMLRGVTQATPGTQRWTTRVLIRADWVRTRAAGSCWVRLPALTGAFAVEAQQAGLAALNPETVRPQNTIRVEPPPAGLASAGAVEVRDALVNGTDSRPGPRVGDSVWTCTNQNRPAGDTCLGWAVIDASWRQGFRDAMLLICGVLLSLTVELWLRAGDRTRGSDSTGSDEQR